MSVVPDSPQQGVGWDSVEDVLEGVPDEGDFRVYGFESRRDFEDFVRDELVYGELEDELLSENLEFAEWSKCPECEEEIQEYLVDGALRGEVDIDPRYEFHSDVLESEAKNRVDAEKRFDAYLLVYCPEHEGELFSYDFTWYK